MVIPHRFCQRLADGITQTDVIASTELVFELTDIDDAVFIHVVQAVIHPPDLSLNGLYCPQFFRSRSHCTVGNCRRIIVTSLSGLAATRNH